MAIKSVLLDIDKKILNSFLHRKVKPKKVHLYCTGTPKSGTHSIAYIFDKKLRTEHEPARDEISDIFFKKRAGNISSERIKKTIDRREKRLHLELNSSCFNHIIIEELVEIFPKAKFIHPIRSPRDWLESWINHEINHQSCNVHDKFEPYFNVMFKKGRLPYRKEERVLKDLNLPTIEGMLSYWKYHNLKILKKVPKERLFVFPTEDISNQIDSIVEFAGLDNLARIGNHHAYKAKKKHDVMSSIDSSFVEELIDQYSIDLNKWIYTPIYD